MVEPSTPPPSLLYIGNPSAESIKWVGLFMVYVAKFVNCSLLHTMVMYVPYNIPFLTITLLKKQAFSTKGYTNYITVFIFSIK
jgi:hypothetical protein